MSTTVMSDAMVMPAVTEPAATKAIGEMESEVYAKCDCCELTEECTPAYMERIRERYGGKWICGLCGEAVKDEIVRSERLISTEEALARHMSFCRKSKSPDPPRNSAVDLISAMTRILRRSLDSPRSLRSMPCSPTRINSAPSRLITRSESCIPKLSFVVDSSPYDDELEELKLVNKLENTN